MQTSTKKIICNSLWACSAPFALIGFICCCFGGFIVGAVCFLPAFPFVLAASLLEQRWGLGKNGSTTTPPNAA